MPIVARLRNLKPGKGKNTSQDQWWQTQAEKTTADKIIHGFTDHVKFCFT